MPESAPPPGHNRRNSGHPYYDAPKATLSINEKTAGCAQYKFQWKNVPDGANRGDFGNPVAGKNDFRKGQLDLPTGVAAALAGNSAPTIQFFTSNNRCVSATMNLLKTDDGLRYTARRK